jgi:DNA-binding response OmpR family regulator
MNLGIITPNIFFGESLESLLENSDLTKDRYEITKEVSTQNIAKLDVIISDYKWNKLEDILLNAKMHKREIEGIEKILITEKGYKQRRPVSNFYLNRPFRASELFEALHSIFEKLISKRENKRVIGDITFIVPDRRLIYKDNKSVELTEKESDIILSLLSSSDRGITREEVMSKVWVLNSNIETHTFETHLYRLRKKIKENLFIKNFIINKDGRYYLNNEIIGQKN